MQNRNHFKKQINELFVTWFLLFLVTKLPKYYIIVYLLFLLSKARQAKMKHIHGNENPATFW
jgi:hypothetical protein